MALEIEGALIDIFKVESGISKSGSEWKRRDFLIETEEQYPKKVCITLFGDKVSLLEGVEMQSKIKVSVNIESREYNGKWFHNINAWKIEIHQAAPAQQDQQRESGLKQKETPDPVGEPPSADGGEDLPF